MKSETEETGLACYADFYNTAPVGCVSLTRGGSIAHLNPYAAHLLGLEFASPVSNPGQHADSYPPERGT